jgi:hypothetical protein
MLLKEWYLPLCREETQADQGPRKEGTGNVLG